MTKVFSSTLQNHSSQICNFYVFHLYVSKFLLKFWYIKLRMELVSVREYGQIFLQAITSYTINEHETLDCSGRKRFVHSYDLQYFKEWGSSTSISTYRFSQIAYYLSPWTILVWIFKNSRPYDSLNLQTGSSYFSICRAMGFLHFRHEVILNTTECPKSTWYNQKA